MKKIMTSLFILGFVGLFPRLHLSAATFIVTSTNDTPDTVNGDGICADTMGICTLRAGIMEANAFSGLDTIEFNILPAGPKTLAPTSGYPFINEGVIINGKTQPGYIGQPIIEIDGQNIVSGLQNGFTTRAAHTTIQGLVINTMPGAGIILDTGADNAIIRNNYIGTNISGTVAKPNNEGIFAIAVNNLSIGGDTLTDRNIISGNRNSGINTEGSATYIENNYIGTDVTGTNALPNNSIMNTAAGGVVMANRNGIVKNNVISGNKNFGMRMIGSNNIIQGNKIGTNTTGTGSLPNTGNGFEMRSLPTKFPFAATTDNLVGGNLASDRNIISGNLGNGIDMSSWVSGSSSGLYGAVIENNTFKGNYIGVQIDGATPLKNHLNGIQLHAVDNNTYTSNIIANNLGKGIVATFGGGRGQKNRFSQNSIYKNNALGIDLKNDGSTPNDMLDTDTDANTMQNYVTNLSLKNVGLVRYLRGGLHSVPSKNFTLEIYKNPDGTAGQGKQYLASFNLTTSSSGDATINIPITTSLSKGNYLTALTIDTKGNTSEFSVPVMVN